MTGVISTESLLKALEDSTDESDIKTNHDVLTFLIAYKIEAGKYKVKSSLLHRLYLAWSTSPAERATFSRILGLILPKGVGATYLVNKNSFELVDSLFEKYADNWKPKASTRLTTYKKHIDEFFATYGLSKGTKWIPNTLLYKSFSDWLRNDKKGKRDVGLKNFTRICKIFLKFKVDRRTDLTWFNMSNCDIIGIDRDTIKSYLRHL